MSRFCALPPVNDGPAALVFDALRDVGGLGGAVGVAERHGRAVGGQPPGDRRPDAAYSGCVLVSPIARGGYWTSSPAGELW